MDEEKDLPYAAEVTTKDFYMDDVMSGARDVEQGLVVQAQLIEMMRRGGMTLRKWSSNSQILLESIPESMRETQVPMRMDHEDVIKTLGLFWSPGTDDFMFKVQVPTSSSTLTKRIILSETAKIFDPVGWVAPIIIRAKILIQDLWKLAVGWDDPLPQEVQNYWKEFSGNLSLIESISIPRCIIPQGTVTKELLGFCDASEKAFAAVVYMKAFQEDGTGHVSLVTSKTRVAPVKTISLPRLELCGALLLSDLITETRASLGIEDSTVRCWTDSSVVLSWLRSSPNRWKVFVANRVTQIQDSVSADQWFHVNGVENPADCASRGIDPSELKNHPLWWKGPSWLEEDFKTFHIETKEDDVVITEERKVVVPVNVVINSDSLITKFSFLSRLVRTTAWIYRFIHNCGSKRSNNLSSRFEFCSGPLKVQELKSALNVHVKTVQNESFHDDLQNIKEGKDLPIKSQLAQLKPFIDEEGLIRVGGRIRHAPLLSFGVKHPILLPGRNNLTF